LFKSYSQTRQALDTKQVTCVDLVHYYLKNIEAEKHLNAFVAVYAEEALEKAAQIDQKIANGTAGKLAGMVVGIKDVLCYEGHGLQACSKILDNFESQFTGTVVQRIVDQDAIIIGRQNCDEFAMGSSNENSAFGACLNPIDESRVPGGSSGGSAVAVAADMCLVSLGSDTGGSVRQPASFCGIVGVKPTYSRLSRYGLIAYASSFDVIGVLANNIPDTALVLEVVAGADQNDSTVSFKPVPAYTEELKKNSSYKIAYLKEGLGEGVNEEVKAKMLETIDFLKAEGHTVEAVEFPLLDYILPTYYILTTAEASTNLSRYDGVRYGYRSPNTTDLESMYKLSRSEGFGEEVKRRILLGTFVLSASYYDAYFTKAQKVRRLIQDKTKEILTDFDFILTPTSPFTAFKIGEFSENPLQMYLADIFSVQANVVGIPATSIPKGQDAKGLPIGLQVMANAFEEGKLLAFSDYLMRN